MEGQDLGLVRLLQDMEFWNKIIFDLFQSQSQSHLYLGRGVALSSILYLFFPYKQY